MSTDLVQDAAVRTLASQVAGVRQLADEIQITDQKSLEWATVVLTEVDTHEKAAETRRVFFVKPLNDHVKRINDFFRELTAPLAEANRTLRQKIVVFRAAERRRLEEEQRAAAVEAAAAESKPNGEMPPAPASSLASTRPAPTVSTPMGSVTARKKIDFELVDLSQVPQEYLELNRVAVRIAIQKGVREIPGLRIFETEQLAVRK